MACKIFGRGVSLIHFEAAATPGAGGEEGGSVSDIRPSSAAGAAAAGDSSQQHLRISHIESSNGEQLPIYR